MYDFKLFDLLPNGVIVFRDEKVEHVNQHLLDVMNIGYLNKQNAVEILTKTIGLENENELFSYFSSHPYFVHKSKVVQIERSDYDNLSIFSFILVQSVLLCDEKPLDEEPIRTENIDAKVAQFFKQNSIKKVKVHSFYRGLPLKNFGQIIKINRDEIEIRVDRKHLISLLEKDVIILIFNEKKDASILYGHVASHSDTLFSVKNFSLFKEHMHQREGIRIKPNDDMKIKAQEKEFRVYDISQKGISIYIQDAQEEQFLKNQKSMQLVLDKTPLRLETEYLKTVYVENQPLKIVFLILPTDTVFSKIQNYLSITQNEIIREIHNYLNK